MKKAKKEIKEELEPEAHMTSKVSGKLAWMTLKYWKYKLWWKTSQDKLMLINMELRNGQHASFLIKAKEQRFRYKGGSYVIDDELKYYNVSEQLWCLDYHQDLAMPVKRDIPVNIIKKTLEAAQITEVEYAANPTTLERFITAKIAEGIMKGQEISEFLKNVKIWVIVTAVAAIVHLFLFMFKTGMLQSIKIPGFG